MADAARDANPRPAPVPRRNLALVPRPLEATPDIDDATVGRSALIGAVIGFVAVAIGLTIAGTVGGLGFVPALGLGVFVGAWSGAGFGFMFGSSAAVRRFETGSIVRLTSPQARPTGR